MAGKELSFRELVEAHRKFLKKRGKYPQISQAREVGVAAGMGARPGIKSARTTKEILEGK